MRDSLPLALNRGVGLAAVEPEAGVVAVAAAVVVEVVEAVEAADVAVDLT